MKHTNYGLPFRDEYSTVIDSVIPCTPMYPENLEKDSGQVRTDSQ